MLFKVITLRFDNITGYFDDTSVSEGILFKISPLCSVDFPEFERYGGVLLWRFPYFLLILICNLFSFQ